MHATLRAPLCTALAATLCAATLLLAPASSHAEGDAPQIVGSWRIRTEPPVTFIPPHLAFSTFTAGGAMISSPIIYLPPPYASMGTGHGSWTKSGGRSYAMTFVAFAYDSGGRPAGTVKASASVELDGHDAFVGRSHISICDLELRCAAPNPGFARITGTRIAVEPLPAP